MNEELERILEESDEMVLAFSELLEENPDDGTPRSALIIALCGTSFEHGFGSRMLVRHGLIASAVALLRVQFETVVRVIWMHYVASDEWFTQYLTPHPSDRQREGVDSRPMSVMLKELAVSAPPEVCRMLNGFKDTAWSQLNSYVHSGIQPVALYIKGHDEEYTLQIVRHANGLTCMTTKLLALRTGDADLTAGVDEIQRHFRDCVPPLISSESFAR